MMRITTNGIFRGYRTDLGNSYYKFSKAMTKVTTQRNFGAYSEDVSAASRAFQLRRSHWRTCTQINNSDYVISKFQTGWSAIDYIVDGEGMEDNLNSIVESLRGLNSPTGSARTALGQSVLAKSESIIRLLNTRYGDQFVFAGADGRNVPYTWETDEAGNTYLAYRGLDVSTPVPIMSAEELKDHIRIKYNPQKTEVTDEELSLQEIADRIGQQRGAGTYELTYDSATDQYTLLRTDTAGAPETLTAAQVVNELGLPANDGTGATEYTYSLGGPNADGNFTLTTTATSPESWEVTFDDALAGQGFKVTLDPNNKFDTGEEAQAELEAILNDLDKEFENYKVQFDEIYASYTHVPLDENGKVPVDEETGEPIASAYANYEKLLAMSREATYVDVGIGVDWYEDAVGDHETGDLISSSAYNSALNGLNFLGFGSTVGEDGELHSNNLAVLMQEMGNVLEACDDSTGAWPEGWDFDRVSALTKKIARSVDDISVQHVRLSNEVAYLETNRLQLTAQRDNLNEQILGIEQVDPANAINEFLYARYAYNAALSVGNSVLTNTLLDYLR